MALHASHPQWGRPDLWAAAGILSGWALLLVLVSPVRTWGYLDDWVYARAVEKWLATGSLAPVDYAQATLVTHLAWGALWTRLLGPGFTALTVATLVMGLLAVGAFYALLRVLGFGPGLSSLGVAVLGLHPYVLLLGYSYMSEIPFLALLLAASLATLLGLQRDHTGWLLVGSALAAAALLTRQFGLVVPLAAVLWLFLARRLTWQRGAAVAVLPLLAGLAYIAWSRGFPPTFSDSVGREALLDLIRAPGTWARRAAHFIYLALFLPGLTLPLWGRVRHWRIAAPIALATAGLVAILWRSKAAEVAAGSSSLDDLSLTWLQPVFGDPTAIYCLGAGLTVWLVAGVIERSAPGLWARLRARTPCPADFLVVLAILLFGGTYLASAGFLDRYWVPLLPFLIIGGLAGLRGARAWRLGLVLIPLALGAGYGLAAHHDDWAALEAHWQAGRALLAAGVPPTQIENGYPWNGYYLYDQSIAGLPSHDVTVIGRDFAPLRIIDPLYIIAPAPRPGYQVVSTVPYSAWLQGGVQREMLVLRRE